jgi:hypothetical protein
MDNTDILDINILDIDIVQLALNEAAEYDIKITHEARLYIEESFKIYKNMKSEDLLLLLEPSLRREATEKYNRSNKNHIIIIKFLMEELIGLAYNTDLCKGLKRITPFILYYGLYGDSRFLNIFIPPHKYIYPGVSKIAFHMFEDCIRIPKRDIINILKNNNISKINPDIIYLLTVFIIKISDLCSNMTHIELKYFYKQLSSDELIIDDRRSLLHYIHINIISTIAKIWNEKNEKNEKNENELNFTNFSIILIDFGNILELSVNNGSI